MKIGIGITHHNRHEQLADTLSHFAKFLPKEAIVVIVDDASDTPVPDEVKAELPIAQVYRFTENLGIARAKNACLSLLDDCDHIFLFDDDTYPIAKDWEKPYIESPEPHLMFNFMHFKDGTWVGDGRDIYVDDELVASGHGRGCMLYVDHKVLDVVGGMRVEFGKAMWEHIEWSRRIHNAGLTRFKYADIPNSTKLIYNVDWDKKSHSVSSINMTDRSLHHRINEAIAKKYEFSKDYVPYKIPAQLTQTVITSYFTCGMDTQRNMTWESNRGAIKPLVDSVKDKLDIVILNDCGWNETVANGSTKATWINVSSYGNPYFWRWKAQYDYLKNNDIDHAWLVDATDVHLLDIPQMLEYQWYSGDEETTLSNPWLLNQSKTPDVRRKLQSSRGKLLNCGVVGASKDMLMELCRFIWDRYADTNNVYQVEMPFYNEFFLEKNVIHGKPVNTIFKAFESEGAWWKHK